MLLGYNELKDLVAKKKLVDEMIDPEVQIQPNGIELTLRRVEKLSGIGAIAFDNAERVLPASSALEFGDDGWITLSKGSYKVIFNEIVNMPNDIAAIARPRSSLLRCGATMETAVWDAGYSGRSESLLVVHGGELRLRKDARILQLLFMRIESPVVKGYSGIYQNENIQNS
ncbi:MAG TPA: deoxyuridine 5'-triphosphate nucleotidohydrolase [Candidatus Methanoperedenaceae archaeon]|nr:deoxyuridine 5'-triphosphate nucleotidohydrolase [Candidatus Methanoperedenaceae archaeon]